MSWKDSTPRPEGNIWIIDSCLLEQLLPFSSSSRGSRSQPVSPSVTFPGKTHPRLVNLHQNSIIQKKNHTHPVSGSMESLTEAALTTHEPPGLAQKHLQAYFGCYLGNQSQTSFWDTFCCFFPLRGALGLTLGRDLSHLAVPHGIFPGKTQRHCSITLRLGCNRT